MDLLNFSEDEKFVPYTLTVFNGQRSSKELKVDMHSLVKVSNKSVDKHLLEKCK